MVDLEALTKAWQAARKTLDTANDELRVAKAGHETATRCEREAWEAMSKCREQDEAPKPAFTPDETGEALRKAQTEQMRGAANAWPTGQVSYIGTHLNGSSWPR